MNSIHDGVAGRGAIATSHDAATEAGARILEGGGTAVDAAIAAAAMLCVVYPHNVALGGDLVALVRDPAGRTRFVNATGRAASAETRDALVARHGDAIPSRGVDAVTVPGGVRGWAALAAIGGSMSWRELLSPAREAAAQGHPVSRSLANSIVAEQPVIGCFAPWSAVFAPGGRALREGEQLVQPALARTFDRLIAGGPDAFYTGELAERWVAGIRAAGSRISLEDAATFRATEHEPIRARVFGYDVLTSPPNTQGFSLLRTLGRAERMGLADPLGADAGSIAELFHEGNRIRTAGLADPDVGPGADELIAMEAPEFVAGAANALGDTVGLTVVADGWAVSLVQSVFDAFGSGVLEPETGIIFQNRGAGFSLDADAVNAFAGGRRPPHTLMPVLVERANRLVWALATMGGQAQPQIHAQLFLRLREGSSAIEATSAPRFVVGWQDVEDTPDSVIVEADADPIAVRSLRATALRSRLVAPRWELMGHSNVIRVMPDGYDAASDPRSDGSARVVAGGRS
jgi:gamma-glutamyltranspeptidase/glutathione hydrolase